MDASYRSADDVAVLPSHLDVPGLGTLIVNSFVLLAKEPVLIDSGLAVDGPEFVDALRAVIDPDELKWIWLTHDDADHSGNLQSVMDLAPNARLATHGVGALRQSTLWPLPLERVHALAPGDSLDLGDRVIRAVVPPTYDNPTSTGAFDESTKSFFCVDSFGAILPNAVQDVNDLTEGELTGGMVAWTSLDSPWTRLTDRSLFGRVLDDVRRLDPDRLFSAHLPASSGQVEQFLKVVASAPDADPFVPPDATAFGAIVADILARGV